MLMINKVFFILVICLCHISMIYCQTLTKDQMLEDLNFMESKIKQYYIPLPLLENRTGVCFVEEFNFLKSKITKDEPIENFVELVRQGLNIINDPHSQIVRKDQIKWYVPNSYLSAVGNVTLKDTISADYFHSLVSDTIYSKIKCQILVKYINGSYYNVRPFGYENLIVDSGEQITAIDGVPMNDFVNKYRNMMLFTSWDPILKQWFCESFKVSLPLIGKTQFTLTVGGKDLKLDCGKPLTILSREFTKSYSPQVYLIDNNILYIRMPMMMNVDWYREELLKKYTPDVKKIIIDIRDNGGGDDSVWQDLLKVIINKPLTYQYKVQIPNNDTLIHCVHSFGDIRRIGNNVYVESDRVIEPDSNSINYDGKIYILQNKYTFSAAAALSSVAWQNPDLILVGEPTVTISGYTFPAIMFKLPNSQVVFNLAFSCDAVGGSSNPFMDKVEVQIAEDADIKGYVDKIMNYDYYGLDYIMNKDKLIKYIKSVH
ncbi:hypothetical protein SDC9_63124 [bioreactor metagenome]|uniref:Tail specific protease domain-containing protein n=1 Tax=bioreactor metagenome TaxID=1076179 RepID=A0A644XR70_9ZZZZ